MTLVTLALVTQIDKDNLSSGNYIGFVLLEVKGFVGDDAQLLLIGTTFVCCIITMAVSTSRDNYSTGSTLPVDQ